MTQLPARAGRFERQMRMLIENAERAAAVHDDDLIDFARTILAGRKARDRYFNPLMFSNPAWDMLLHIFLANAEGRAIDAVDSCSATTVPQGVALRWLSFLKQEEMVIETTDPAWPRQTVIRLADPTRLAISAYLATLINLGPGTAPARATPDTPPAAG